MTPLPPTLREKHRYILAKAICGAIHPPEPKQVYLAVCEAAGTLFGDVGMAKIRPVVIASSGDYFILRCTRGQEQHLAVAIAAVFRIGEARVALRTLATSGTIRSLKERIPAVPVPEPEEEIRYNKRLYAVRKGPRGKIDLVEKGIKSQKTLFFIQNDLEEN